jgi:hypothetical protein
MKKLAAPSCYKVPVPVNRQGQQQAEPDHKAGQQVSVMRLQCFFHGHYPSRFAQRCPLSVFTKSLRVVNASFMQQHAAQVITTKGIAACRARRYLASF